MSEFDRSLAIVIGINDYQNGIDKLQTAVPDASAIAEILHQTYKYELIHPDLESEVVVNEYATKAKLEKLFTDILPNQIKPTKSDRLIFYFAGHGIARNSDNEPQGFLVPQDADMKNLDSLIKMSDIHDWLSKLECKHLLIILDCCFAGAFRWASYRKLIPFTTKTTKAHYDRFIRFPAWQVLTSASDNQEALDFINNRDKDFKKDTKEDHKHSPFAKGLIEALQPNQTDLNNDKKRKNADLNGDGVIIATELYLYLRNYVEINTKDQQTPGFFPLRKHDRGEYLFKLSNFSRDNLNDSPPLNTERNPYRGLEPFEEKHTSIFFGRDEVLEGLVTKVTNLVQVNNQLTVVTGISGSGKSSLVKAGLIPTLDNDSEQKWHILAAIKKDEDTNEEIREIIRPGSNPYATVARAIANLTKKERIRTGDTTTILGKKLKDSSSQFIADIKTWSQAHPNTRLLLVIDQFEELITLAPRIEKTIDSVKKNWAQKFLDKLPFSKTESESESEIPEVETEQWKDFIELLAKMLRECPQLSLVITLRSDFEPRFQDSAFSEIWANARFVVRPMRSDELREAVEKPAAEKALYFDPPELVDRLVDEVSQMPGALPLLSFTLSEMYLQLTKDWETGIKEDRSLTVGSNFESEGGVAGALTRRANEEFRNLPSPKKAHRLTMKRVMLRMVELEGGEAVRRKVLESELIYPLDEENDRVKTVLAKLQQARLIVTGTDAEANEAYYEPAHDYLVRGWERLQVWITKEQDSLALQDLLTPSAKAWKKEDKDLWDTNSRLDRLKEIQDKDTSDDNWLNKIESDFVELSYKTKERKQKMFLIRSVVVISVITVISTLATMLGFQSNRQVKMAKVQELAARSESIKEQRANLHETSVLLALESYKRSNDILESNSNRPASEAHEVLYNGLDFLPNQLPKINHEDEVEEIEFSSNDQYFATASKDGTVKLVEFATGHETIIVHKDIVWEIEFSGDNRYLATASADGTTKLIELATGHEKKTISHKGVVREIMFSPDSRYLATTGCIADDSGSRCLDGTVKLIELNTNEENIIFHQEGAFANIKFSEDNQYFAIASWDGTVKLIELATDKETTIPHGGEVWEIKFSPDNQYLATRSKSGTVLVELSTGKKTTIFDKDWIEEIKFSGNSRYLAIRDFDGVVKLIKLGASEEEGKVISDDLLVRGMEFSPDNRYLVTRSRDGTAKLIGLDTDNNPTIISHETLVEEIKFSSDSRYLATRDFAGIVKLIKLGASNEKEKVISPEGLVNGIEFSLDNRYLATASENGIVKLIELSTGKEKKVIYHRGEVDKIGFGSENKYLATASRDGTSKLVELSTGEEIFISHEGEVIEIKFSSENKYLATASRDGTSKLVEL
ncbi:MAG: caspase family protein, partial [Cyanobacteria bacterium P01_F01_bin.143]